ncbi:MAG: YbaK/EbsC family protein [Pseudomonadota bacterium]
MRSQHRNRQAGRPNPKTAASEPYTSQQRHCHARGFGLSRAAENQPCVTKAFLFRTGAMGDAVLFITAGGAKVDDTKAAALAGSPWRKPMQRSIARGPVLPLAVWPPSATWNLSCAWYDHRSPDFPVAYAAAGMQRHIFAIVPQDLLVVSGAKEAAFI